MINLLPASGNAPGFDPQPEASDILALKVSRLLQHSLGIQKFWWPITEIIEQTTTWNKKMDGLLMVECHYLTYYLHACARVDWVHEDDHDRVTALGIIAWFNFPCNLPLYQLDHNKCIRLRTAVALSPFHHPPPHEPMAVNGLSRGEASSFLLSKVFDLLDTPSARHSGTCEYWWSITQVLRHCMDELNSGECDPTGCKKIATYLRVCAGVHQVPSHDEDAIEHTACLGLIAWVNHACNKDLFISFLFHATQTPASLLDHHPGDNYYLALASHYSTSPPAPPNPQFDGMALVRRGLPKLIDLSTSDKTCPSTYDPSPGAGAILRDSILQLLALDPSTRTINPEWYINDPRPINSEWDINNLIQELVCEQMYTDHTPDVLCNYLGALGRLGDALAPTDHHLRCAGLLA